MVTAGSIRVAVVLASLLLGGCSVSLGRAKPSGDARAPSIVHDNALTLDFRTRPSRADVGFPADRNSRSYSGDRLMTTLVLPTGTAVVPAFDVTASTDAEGGALDSNYAHQPKDFLISSRFSDTAAARTSLLGDAATLGVSEADLAQALPQPAAGAVIPQQRVLHGLVRDWLSVDVELMDGEGGQVVVEYSIGIDVFHNPAVDRVVHDGVLSADLTRKPTRADLGMLDGYSNADVRPAWGQQLTLRLRLPDGELDDEVSSVSTSSGAGDVTGAHPPLSTSIQLAPSSAAALRRRMGIDAPLVGLDAKQVASVFNSPAGAARIQRTLPGRSTAAYTVSARFDVTPNGDNAFSAVVTYRFSYK